MKQGKIVTDRKRKYKISDGKITVLTYVVRNDMGTERELWENVEYFNTAKDSYEEYIEPKPLTGWERVDEERSYYYIDGLVNVKKTFEANHEIDETVYEKANYFSTKEKAEEINFKQTLFRKLQRFSDENGGNEIDWNNSRKYFIEYYSKGEKLAVDYAYRLYNFGQVYFASREIAEKAIELFHDELIKYFTGDFGGEA